MEIIVQQRVLQSNEETARENRKKLDKAGVLGINLLGSPGSGKTTLLEKTFAGLRGKMKVAVIEGDLYTSKDADRIKKYGLPVVQINTSGGCHLDSKMVEKVIPQFKLDHTDLLVIENVGNLVCPAAYELGEHFKVVVLSIAEGGDKVLKYPRIFLESKAIVVNKTDLLPFSDVDINELRKDILKVNPAITIFEMSCRTGLGLKQWTNWLEERVSEHGGISKVTA